MQNNSVWPDILYGMFGRQLPNFDEPIQKYFVELKHLDVPTNKVRALANDIMGDDWVAVNENFLDNIQDQADAGGVFTIYLQAAAGQAFIGKWGEHDLVNSVGTYPWWDFSRNELKPHFPDELGHRHFCSQCDVEKKDEMAPCENGGCPLGLVNFSGMQDQLLALQATMKADAGSFEETVAEAALQEGGNEEEEGLVPVEEVTHVGYKCPSCDTIHSLGSHIDCDGDIDCYGEDEDGWDCDYFNAEENKHYE